MNFQSCFCGALLVISFTVSNADEPMDAFLTKLKTAIEAKDAVAMEALHDKEGATPLELERLRSSIASGFKYLATGTPKTMKPVPLSDEYSFDVVIHNGERMEPSIKPVGMIRIEYEKRTSLKPYAIKGGTPLLVGTKITKLNWDGPPDRPFWINIQNSSEKKRKVIIEGTYNASGMEMKLDKTHQFGSDSTTSIGGWGTGINGQHLIVIKITTDGEDGDLKATIKEGEKPGAMPDKLIIEQPVSATKPLLYEGKKP